MGWIHCYHNNLSEKPVQCGDALQFGTALNFHRPTGGRPDAAARNKV